VVGRRRKMFELSGLELDRSFLAVSLADLSKWLRVPEELDSACYYAERCLQILREQRQRSSLSLQTMCSRQLPKSSGSLRPTHLRFGGSSDLVIGFLRSRWELSRMPVSIENPFQFLATPWA
jgi:hypothetical protein